MSKPNKGDFFGRPLNPGDLVIAKVPYNPLLQLCKVIKCTPSAVRVNRINDDGTLWSWSNLSKGPVFIMAAADVTPDVVNTLLKARAYK